MRKAEAATRIEAYLEEVKLKEWEKDGTVGRVRPDGSGPPKMQQMHGLGSCGCHKPAIPCGHGEPQTIAMRCHK